MGAMKNLQKDRNGTFYVRLVVPQSLRPILGKGELKRSLKTKDWREANQRAHAVLQELDQLFEAAKMDASILHQDLVHAVTRWSNWVIEHLDDPEVYFSFVRKEWDAGRHYYTDNSGDISGLLEDFERATTPERRERILLGLCQLLSFPLRMTLSLSNMRLLENSCNAQALALLLAKEYLKLSQLVLNNMAINAKQRDQGQPEVPLVPSSVPAITWQTTKGTKLSVLFKSYQDALLRREPKKAAARIAEYTPAIERFIEFLGDKPIDSITKQNVAEFRNLLEQLPTRPKQEVAKLPLRQQIVVTQEQGLPRLNLATVQKLIRGLSAVLAHAVDDGLMEQNPVHGVKVQASTVVATDDDEHSFRPEEIRQIFGSPLFVRGEGPVQADFGEAPYWIPLMLYYTGARVEELCQLYVADIRQEQGISFIRIAEQRDDQKLKNVSSNRDVPIHSHLLELGFLEYVQRLPADGRLFPKLNASGHKATYSARLGVWWGKYLVNTVQISRSGVRRFHSFRHTFMTVCRAVGLREDVQNAITGHSQHTDRTHTGRNYGVYTHAVKQEAIEKIPRLAVTRPRQE